MSRYCKRVGMNEARGTLSLESIARVLWHFLTLLLHWRNRRDTFQCTSSLVRQTSRGPLRRFDTCGVTAGVTLCTIVDVNGNPRAISFGNQGHSRLGFDSLTLIHTKERVNEAVRGTRVQGSVESYAPPPAIGQRSSLHSLGKPWALKIEDRLVLF